MAIRQDSFRIEEGKDYLAYVKDFYGEDAEIVKVSQVKGRTPTSPALVEVVVAVDEKDNQKSTINKRAVLEYSTMQSTKSARQNAEIANIENEIFDKPQRARLSLAAKTTEKIKDDRQLLNELNSKVEYLMKMRWGELAPTRNNLEIPPEFSAIYEKAKSSDMLQSHLDKIMLATLNNMPAQFLKNKDAIDRYFKTLLKNMIPCRIDSHIRKQKIIMLVGPTGVGKTTSLAKLAYRYAYVKRYKTAIVSLDNFRLGAQEQLAEYARYMDLPISFVTSANELQKSLESLIGYDVILIDSTGNSQYDKSKIEKLEGYLLASDKIIDVTLVLNAGMKYDDMLETFNAFDILKIDTLLFTKFDETKAFGNIFSLIITTEKPASFFSIGQNVPDDIVVASGEYLINCVLSGFKKDN